MGSQEYGLDALTVDELARELVDVRASGLEIALVIGGGNIYRGMSAAAQGIDRATGDYMGMIATVLNALAVQEALERNGADTRVLTAIAMQAVAEPYIRRRAPRARDRSGGDPDGEARGGGRPRRRSPRQPRCEADPGADALAGDRARVEGDGHDRPLALHGQRPADPRLLA